MNLNHHNQSHLLKRLPDLKLPYDNIHKKVFSDLYVLIPKGKKHIAWFTYFQDKRVCIFIEVTLGGQKQINEMFIVPQSYDKKLVLGTLFFGTVFNIDKKKYYSIENIHYYKGKNIENNNEKYKLSLIKNILEKELKSCFLTNKGICMAMPIIESKFENCVETAKLLSYKIHSIQNRNLHGKNNNYSSTLFKQIDDDVKSKIFIVKAQLQNDVYDLYYYNSRELKKYDIAYIPDYKTSTMMNNIFRKIKENLNLDALEESDDEEEFENINDDKYVDLNKCVKMECEFNKKFNKFVPIKIMENGKVCNIKEIK